VEDVFGRSTDNSLEDLKRDLEDLLPVLDRSIEDLVADNEGLKNAFLSMADRLPEELMLALNPVAFIDLHRLPLRKALDRLSARKNAIKIADKVAELKDKTLRAKADHEQSVKSMEPRLKRAAELEKEITDLEAALARKRIDLASVKAEIASATTEVNQKNQLFKSAVRETIRQASFLKPIPGTDDEDRAIIDSIDKIRRDALAALRRFLG
jgi:septal ring factor EnvC (AmiA/AmiB activator)